MGGSCMFERNSSYILENRDNQKNRLTEADHIRAQNTQAVLHHTATPPGGVAVLGRYANDVK